MKDVSFQLGIHSVGSRQVAMEIVVCERHCSLLLADLDASCVVAVINIQPVIEGSNISRKTSDFRVTEG